MDIETIQKNIPADSRGQRLKLYDKYKHLIETDKNLDRTLVSFQANKKESFYKWFKYKEGFSSSLVNYFLNKYHPKPGCILDPFAGSGATLFASRNLGWNSTGIELLPVGEFAISARIASERIEPLKFRKQMKEFWNSFDSAKEPFKKINHIPITDGAFPSENEIFLNKYLNHCEDIGDEDMKTLFRFAGFCILEDIIWTRKDGQYLRWDHRANKGFGKIPFDKGKIWDFKTAIDEKLRQIGDDLEPDRFMELFPDDIGEEREKGNPPVLLQGSSLEIMPKMEEKSFDFIMTSPPYCNRYDYTRTYALELVFLGYDNEQIKNLRQKMLSCTVENREKVDKIQKFYESIDKHSNFKKVIDVYNSCPAMQEVNNILENLNREKKLNNSGIPRMVKNYFLESAFIVFEMERVLRPGGFVVMVNDNVRYGGEEVPVDLILSDFAESFGLVVEKIWTLPTGKGNSSQQMGEHGRQELRKSVYIWKKI